MDNQGGQLTRMLWTGSSATPTPAPGHFPVPATPRGQDSDAMFGNVKCKWLSWAFLSKSAASTKIADGLVVQAISEAAGRDPGVHRK